MTVHSPKTWLADGMAAEARVMPDWASANFLGTIRMPAVWADGCAAGVVFVGWLEVGGVAGCEPVEAVAGCTGAVEAAGLEVSGAGTGCPAVGCAAGCVGCAWAVSFPAGMDLVCAAMPVREEGVCVNCVGAASDLVAAAPDCTAGADAG